MPRSPPELVVVTDLSQWLLAQIVDDQEVAWDVLERPNTAADVGSALGIRDDGQLVGVMVTARRVLEECDAHRRIINLHRAHGTHDCPTDRDVGIRIDLVDCAVLRLLAVPYADRDGYLEEWRP